MKLSILPAGTTSTASSRIRIFSLLEYFNISSTTVNIGYNVNSDILVVQKKVNLSILKSVLLAKISNKLIVYDIDDSAIALSYWARWPYYNLMLKLADVITTDTVLRRKQLQHENPKAFVELLPDCIDYFPTCPVTSIVEDSNDTRILWFGSIGTFGLFEKYITTLRRIRNLKVVIVVNDSSCRDLSERYPDLEIHSWKLGNFLSVLRSCHLSLLVHDGTDIDRMKSNNKMITSITWGVPAIVSNTDDYRRTAEIAGISNVVFSNEAELVSIISELRRPEKRIEYLNKAQGVVWEKFSPMSVATAAETIYAKHLQLHKQKLDHLLTVQNFKKSLLSRLYVASRSFVSHVAHSMTCRIGFNLPAICDIRNYLRINKAVTVLIFGHLSESQSKELAGEFHIQTVSRSIFSLKLLAEPKTCFYVRIHSESSDFFQRHTDEWDVVITLNYLSSLENDMQFAQAMNNLMLIAKNKIILWEPDNVCASIRKLSSHQKFECFPLSR